MFTQVCVSVHWCTPVSHSLMSVGRNVSHLEQEQSENRSPQRAIKWQKEELTQKSWRCSHPGTAGCPAAGIPPDTHTRTSPARSHTGIGTGSWSSCTHRCLLSLQLQVSLSTTSSSGIRGSPAMKKPCCPGRFLTIAGEAVGPQLEALLTATQEGSVCVVTPLRAGGSHVTFVHILKMGR